MPGLDVSFVSAPDRHGGAILRVSARPPDGERAVPFPSPHFSL